MTATLLFMAVLLFLIPVFEKNLIRKFRLPNSDAIYFVIGFLANLAVFYSIATRNETLISPFEIYLFAYLINIPLVASLYKIKVQWAMLWPFVALGTGLILFPFFVLLKSFYYLRGER